MHSVNGSSKGMLQNSIVLWIVGFVALIVILFFLRSSGEASADVIDIEECRNDVRTHAQSKIGQLRFIDEITQCQPYVVEVDGSEEEARRQVAEAQRTCWYMFWEGSRDLYEEEGTICHVCSYLELKQDATDLGVYYATHEVPRGEQTYAEYLQGYTTEDARAFTQEEIQQLAGSYDLEKDKRYATLFIYAKGEDQIKSIRNYYTSDAGRYTVLAGTGVGLATSGALAIVTGGIAFGPPGWIVAGTIIGVGVATGGLTSYGIDSIFRPDAVEWMSFTVIQEWNDQTAEKLRTDLHCDFISSG